MERVKVMYTVVYISDDLGASCFGRFASRSAAQKFAEKMERDLDSDRDEAGGGVGRVHVCLIQTKDRWQ